MFEALCRRLMTSAAGRYLAIDLIKAHGDAAPQVLARMMREGANDPAALKIMQGARRVLSSVRPRSSRQR